jgi:acyl-CoA hydrolase
MSAEEAVRSVNSGDRVFIHGSAATPVRLGARIAWTATRSCTNVELTAISTFGELGFERPEVQGRLLPERALRVGEHAQPRWTVHMGDYVPVFLSEIPRLFEQGVLPVDVALVHVSPPDKSWLLLLLGRER